MTSTPLIVALDHDDAGAARTCVDRLEGVVDRFKIGSVLYTRCGPSLVEELIDGEKRVFLDLKFHDTPATVAGAARAAADLGVEMLTVHAAGGATMIEAARGALGSGSPRPRLVAVTILTSLDAEAYAVIFGAANRSLAAAVSDLAALAVKAGADGCVCSADEVGRLRANLGPEPRLVVPGIRPDWSTSSHRGQARTAAPRAALDAGASDLVVGRAITHAADPAEAADRVLREIGE